MNYQTLKQGDYVVLLDRMVVLILDVSNDSARVIRDDGSIDSIPFSAIRIYASKGDIELFDKLLKEKSKKHPVVRRSNCCKIDQRTQSVIEIELLPYV
jgi:hypothetical protein